MHGVVGREAELEKIDAFLAGLVDGPGGLVIEGEAGIGKTTLWQEAVRRAGERRFAVLSSRAVQSEARLSFTAVSDLLASVPEAALASLPSPQRRALGVALLREDPAGAPPDRRAVATALGSVLAMRAQPGPVLVAVDDAHWLDRPSAEALEFAFARLARRPVGLLMALRMGEPEPFALARGRAPGFVRIEVGPLRPGVLRRVISMHLGSPPRRSVLRQAERLAGGNPLFALEIARLLHGRDGCDGPGRVELLTIPGSLHELVRDRVTGLPEPTIKALLTAAALSEPTLEQVNVASLAAGEEAGLVRVDDHGRIAFTHPLFAWAVYASASTQKRRSVHRRLARARVSPEERARHLALGTPRPDSHVASQLEESAGVARGRGAPAAAAELLEHARRLTPAVDVDGWARRCAAAIPVLVESGDWERAGELTDQALARLPAGPARAAILLEAANMRPGAADLCRQALAESAGDLPLSVRAHLMLCQQPSYALDGAAGLAHAEAALEAARGLGDRGLIATALTFIGITKVMSGVGDPTDQLAQARSIEAELGARLGPAGISATTWTGGWHAFRDEPLLARRFLEPQLQLVLDSGDETGEIQVGLFVADLELRAGDWPRAHAIAQHASELAELGSYAQGRAGAAYWSGLILAHRGELDAAAAAAADGLRISAQVGERAFAVADLGVLASVAVARADYAAALPHLTELRSLIPRDADPPVWALFEGDELEALVATGAHATAQARIDSLERRGRLETRPRLLAWAARGRALLAAAEGDLEGARSAIAQALSHHGSLPVPFELARTLLVEGRLARRARSKAAPRAAFGSALEIFEQLGARVWVDTARAELERVAGRTQPGELSETEARVARLAAGGHTNRQIAAKLFISPRTVETNLARAYRKLGVSSRAQLGAHFAVHADPREPSNGPG